MRRSSFALLELGIVAALAACTANDDIPAPAIAGISPDHATPNSVVVLEGSYFCQQPEDDGGETDPLACRNTGTVLFGTVQVSPEQYTDTSITAQVPELSTGHVNVTVSVAGRVSNAVVFVLDGGDVTP